MFVLFTQLILFFTIIHNPKPFVIFFFLVCSGSRFFEFKKYIVELRLENIVEEEGHDGNLRQSERTTQLISGERKRSSMERERERNLNANWDKTSCQLSLITTNQPQSIQFSHAKKSNEYRRTILTRPNFPYL